MKMLVVNRKGIVSILAMMLYIFGVQGILVPSLLLVGCGSGDDGEEVVTPAAAFVSAHPPGGEITANATITLTFDNTPTDVTVTAGTVTVAGKNAVIVGPFTRGPLALTINWADGSQTLNYIVTGPDNNNIVPPAEPEVNETGPDNNNIVPPAEPEVNEELVDRGVCAVGMKLKQGEKCRYVADQAKVVFSVKEDGTACREGGPVFQVIFGAKVRVDNFNICVGNDIERDDAFNSDFSASKNPDGSWTIEMVP